MSYTVISPKLIRHDGIYIALYVGTMNFTGVYFCNAFALSSNGSFLDDYKPIDENLPADDWSSLNSNLLYWQKKFNSESLADYNQNCKLTWTHTCLSIFKEDEFYPTETKIYLLDTTEIFMEIFDISKDGSAFMTSNRRYKFISNQDIDKHNINKTVQKLFADARPSKPSFLKRLGF